MKLERYCYGSVSAFPMGPAPYFGRVCFFRANALKTSIHMKSPFGNKKSSTDHAKRCVT